MRQTSLKVRFYFANLEKVDFSSSSVHLKIQTLLYSELEKNDFQNKLKNHDLFIFQENFRGNKKFRTMSVSYKPILPEIEDLVNIS